MKRGVDGWAKTKSTYASPGSGVTLAPKLVALIDASFGATSWAAFQAHLSDPQVCEG